MGNGILNVSKRLYIGLLFTIFLVILPNSQQASGVDENLHIPPQAITISLCQDHVTHAFAKQVVLEAYRRVAIKASFFELPCRRSLKMANTGIHDGEVARIAGTTTVFKHLIQLNSPVIAIEGVVFTKSYPHRITKWADLKGLRVGIITGEIYAEKSTEGMLPITVSTYSQLISLLVFDRIDVAIGISRDVKLALALAPVNSRDIHIISDKLFEASLYHLVHEKHRALLPRLNLVFDEMWQSGQANAIYQNRMQHLLAAAQVEK